MKQTGYRATNMTLFLEKMQGAFIRAGAFIRINTVFILVWRIGM